MRSATSLNTRHRNFHHRRVRSLVVCRSQGFRPSLWERAIRVGQVFKQFVDEITAGEDALALEGPPAAASPSPGPPGVTPAAAAAAAVAGEAAGDGHDAGRATTAAAARAVAGAAAAVPATPPTRAGPQAGQATMTLQIDVIDSIAKVAREEWDAVVCSCHGGEVNPFLLWSFLNALEESGSASPRTGWLPQHILVRQVDTDSGGSPTGRLVGCVAVYLKGHSYGEYVFDSSWASYAQMLGIRYYPKLQAAVPFTPVTGPRLMVAGDLAPSRRAAVVRQLGRKLIDMAESLGLSGVHLTFNTAQEWAVLAELGFKQRLGIQFHWDNADYSTFDDFLADLKQSKRKSIRQERKSIQRAGLVAHRLPGSTLLPAHWDRFYSFYTSTVDRKWGNAYLTRDFFHRLGEAMPDRILLVAATEDPRLADSARLLSSSSSTSVSSTEGDDDQQLPSRTAAGARPTASPATHPASLASSSIAAAEAPPADQMVAAALNLVGSHALFGRNWGQADGRDYKNLHFELCYYQALEEAIARGLPRVEAGAQGEHKLQRGYLPSFTYSCHYIRDPRLGSAVDAFLKKERGQMEYTLQMMSVVASPYKKERTVEALMAKLQAYGSLSSGSSSSLDLELGRGDEGKGGGEVRGEGSEVDLVVERSSTA